MRFDVPEKRGLSGRLCPFKCKRCGLSFKRSDRLVAHAFQHTGDKAFACPECGSHAGVLSVDQSEAGLEFSRKSRLNSHIVVKHVGHASDPDQSWP